MSRITAFLLCAAGLASPALAPSAIAAPAIAEQEPLICFGNEPSWSVHLTEPGVARFATPDQEAVVYNGAPNSLDFLRETVWRGSRAGGGDLVVWLRDASCSDGMSDTVHPVTARVSLPDGRFLPGCCRVAPVVAAAAAGVATAGGVEGATWRLTQLPGVQAADLDRLARPVTAQFEDGRVRGFAGCNNFTGGYRLGDGTLTLGNLASNMMACPGPAMAIENAFHAGFAGALRYAIAGDDLTLTAASGARLSFVRLPPPRLDGSSWNVTSYNNNRQAVVGVMGEGDITLKFADGAVSGSAGCNTFRATYTVAGNGISFGPASTTRRACAEDLMTQEREFLAALASAVTWSIDGNVLDMHRADAERAIWAVSK